MQLANLVDKQNTGLVGEDKGLQTIYEEMFENVEPQKKKIKQAQTIEVKSEDEQEENENLLLPTFQAGFREKESDPAYQRRVSKFA